MRVFRRFAVTLFVVFVICLESVAASADPPDPLQPIRDKVNEPLLLLERAVCNASGGVLCF